MGQADDRLDHHEIEKERGCCGSLFCIRFSVFNFKSVLRIDGEKPLIGKLKNVIKNLIGMVHDYAHRTEIAEHNSAYYRRHADILSKENEKLKEDSELLDTIWGELGDEKINEILVQAERRQYGEYEDDYESDGNSRPKKRITI